MAAVRALYYGTETRFSFRPRLFECLREYSWSKFLADLNAGLVVGVVALAGAMLFTMGALRLGGLIKFIPGPPPMGFTCGIAIEVMVSQVKPFLGLTLEHDSHVPEKLVALVRALPTLHRPTLLLADGSLAILFAWQGRTLELASRKRLKSACATRAPSERKNRLP